MSRSLLRVFAAFAALLAALPLALWAGVQANAETPIGLRVAGVALEPTGAPRAELSRRRSAWRATEVQIDANGVLRARPRSELGADVDLDALLARVARVGRTGRPLDDLSALFRAWSGNTDLPWPITVDRAAVAAYVAELAQEIDRPPRPAELDERGRLLELSTDGARLDQPAAVRALSSALGSGQRSLRLPVERISSGVGGDALPPVLSASARPVVLATYSTRFETRGPERDRGHNVVTAAGFLDGAVLPAHGRLSFNERVGARSTSRGYREAHVIIQGEMVDGLGGGVCQVASTLHAAAFLAGLDLAEHTPHSRPSTYIPMGLDATVAWPNVDLVLSNPYDFPITVRARTAGGQMIVELFGRRRARRVDWDHRVVDTQPWSDRYVEDPEVPAGSEVVSQRGIRGFVVLRARTVEDGAGVRLEEARIRYPPTDRIIRVAPGALDPRSGQPIATGPSPAIPLNPF